MNQFLHTIISKDLETQQASIQQPAVEALESGKIIYFPTYALTPHADELSLLSPTILDAKHKNISYDYLRQRVAGVATQELSLTVQSFMHRYAKFAKQLVDTLLPHYASAIRWGRTSYRPAEIEGRATSKRKDDTRLHVDAFPATPVAGLRILRVFCNINPFGVPRVWHVGEPFSQVLNHFSPKIPPYNCLQAKLLRLIKTTKTLRTAYDHYMLKMHDRMKLDDHYQTHVTKQQIDFPAQSTWIVFTDHVSHAALSGQFLLEQTFYLPVTAMSRPELAPLRQWEQVKGRLLA